MTTKNTVTNRTNRTVGWHNWTEIVFKAECEGVSKRQYSQLLKFIATNGLHRHLQGFWGRECQAYGYI